MKPTALLINTSRGPLADASALVAALREGRIGCERELVHRHRHRQRSGHLIQVHDGAPRIRAFDRINLAVDTATPESCTTTGGTRRPSKPGS
ncbi:NAD(P)-dependent oxidoreductase [Streptomyces sp. NPDC056333]|uniref:NAD(P)-dependent oxidoreductase n=1 Tax=Streptomyces sp. NPDC056333 TaxID=3345786 RepID=UPI0035D9D2D3